MTGLEEQLASMSSFEAIKDVLHDVHLHDLQCIDIMKMLAAEKAIISYPTGVGKTLMAVAIMRLLSNEDVTRKFLFFGKKDQINQTPAKIEKLCGMPVLATTSAEKDIVHFFQNHCEQYKVLFLTHEAFRNDILMNYLFKHRDEYCGVFIDEAHELSNVGYAAAASVVSGMLRQFRYAYAMTATPIVTSISQLAKLAYIVDQQRFPNPKKLEYSLKRGTFSIEEEPCFFINRTREEFGSRTDYHGIVSLVEPLPHQLIECGGNRLFELCKGDGAYPQVERLIQEITSRKGKRGLIYVNQHSVREWVLPFLDTAGIKYACINGKTNMTTRAEILRQFNEEKSLDVIITSVTAALDLDCDFVIFYEFTVEIKQMIGRAHRGLGDKEMDIIFIITDRSAEIDYFYDNVFRASMLVKEILGHKCDELEQINEELQNAEV